MQSPKFDFKRRDIAEIINTARLKATWKNKVRGALNRQPLPDPLEHLDFHVQLDALCKSLESEVCSGRYQPSPPARILSEKSNGLCRQLVIPSVRDALVLQTLSDALWHELKANAPSPNAFYAPMDHTFSNFKKVLESEYGELNAWLKFQQAILGFSQTRNFVVVTDIANYYDTIVHQHLRNILAEKDGVREHALDLLVFSLSQMLWQPDYMPNSQVGLPQIDLDAPRLLAHCVLFEVDAVFVKRPNTDYARYMDDIDFGVDTVREAKAVLRDLDLTLQTRQMRLNSGKTKILSKEEAAYHFRIRHNSLLDMLEARIEAKKEGGHSLRREQNFLERIIRRGLRSGSFSGGNGEKILKRCINNATKVGADLDDEIIRQVLLHWPATRSTILRWWQNSATPEAQLPVLREFIESGEVIDHVAKLGTASAIVDARLPDSPAVRDEIRRVVRQLGDKDPWSFYSVVWILSKYAEAAELMKYIDATRLIWAAHPRLARLVAGLSPRFVGSNLWLRFNNLTRRHGGRAAADVLDFILSLSTTREGFSAVHKFLLASNPTKPNGITHPKFLMVLAALSNDELSLSDQKRLRSSHSLALTDEFYAGIVPKPHLVNLLPSSHASSELVL